MRFITLNTFSLLADIKPTAPSGNNSLDASSLTDILTNIGVAMGSLVLVFGIIKLIMSIANEDAKSKMDSTIAIGIGILLISITGVLNILNLNSNMTVNGIASNILKVIGTFLTYSGGFLAAYTVLQFIMSIVHENPEQHANASKLGGVSIGLLSASKLTGYVSSVLLGGLGNDGVNYLMQAGIRFMASVASYIGAFFVIGGGFKLILAIREENSKDRDTGIRLLMAGIGLLGAYALLYKMGIITSLPYLSA